jgi:hypothetical protein
VNADIGPHQNPPDMTLRNRDAGEAKRAGNTDEMIPVD